LHLIRRKSGPSRSLFEEHAPSLALWLRC
jgi:hypothetical protein